MVILNMKLGQLISVGFLMGITHRKLSTLLLQRLKEFDITPEQWSVLYQIVSEEGMIQKEIAIRTYKDKPTMTRIINQLETKGFVTRKEGKEDRRSFLIYSTELGQQTILQTIEIEESMADEVKLGIGVEGHDQLHQYLTQLNEYFVRYSEDKE